MKNDKFDPEKFLERIKFSKNISLSVDCIKELHLAFLKNIPFENFDIVLGYEVKIDPKSLFNKLVLSNRGGYCFELNALMLMALEHFGFDVRPVLGRVHLSGMPSGRVHQVSLVTINSEQWIVDVGFGADSPIQPMLLEFNKEVEAVQGFMRFVNDDEFDTMLQSKLAVEGESQWRNLYSFDLGKVLDEDLNCGNFYMSNNPKSLFVAARVASLVTEEGLNTLLNYRLKKVVGGKESVLELRPGKDYIDALKENFGIELKEPYGSMREIALKEL